MTAALVTGGAKRLGRAMALALAGRGLDVALHHRASDDTDHHPVADTLGAIRALGVHACAVQADLAEPDQLATVIAAARDALGGPISVLINSAARFDWDDPVTARADTLAHHYAINTIAPVLLTQALARQADVDTGLVVNMLDQKLDALNGDHLSYTLAKAALAAHTTIAAKAYAPRLRINAIAPGFTLPAPGQSDADFARIHPQTRLGRGPTAEDVTAALLYLLDAKAVTGEVLHVDAGDRLGADVRDYSFR